MFLFVFGVRFINEHLECDIKVVFHVHRQSQELHFSSTCHNSFRHENFNLYHT